MKTIFLIMVISLLITSITMLEATYADETAEISERFLIPLCRPLFNAQGSLSIKEFIAVFERIECLAQYLKKYPNHYDSLIGSVVDIVKNLPFQDNEGMKEELFAIAVHENLWFLFDVLVELDGMSYFYES